jgi:predicted Zn finger-like uncharacterized protein
MNVRCPQCHTVFRVDPDRVPAAGVRARCSQCSAIFGVSRSMGPSGSAEPVTAVLHASAQGGATEPTLTSSLGVRNPATPATASPAAEQPGAETPTKPSFLNQDPSIRAQRLARALISDIVAYNGEKRDQMLAAGALKSEFREEIRKSWEEYVAQVGLDLARTTPYFRDALNELLAKGQRIF